MQFHEELKKIIKEYVHGIYDITEKLPKSEIFGSVSQIRRSSLSILLNYTEGFARKRNKTIKYFLEISYGSLKESLVLLEFTYERKYFSKNEFEKLADLNDKIGKMLWGTLVKLPDNEK